jgi:hypothetical protein
METHNRRSQSRASTSSSGDLGHCSSTTEPLKPRRRSRSMSPRWPESSRATGR